MASPTFSARRRIVFRSLHRITQFQLTPKHTYNLIDNLRLNFAYFMYGKDNISCNISAVTCCKFRTRQMADSPLIARGKHSEVGLFLGLHNLQHWVNVEIRIDNIKCLVTLRLEKITKLSLGITVNFFCNLDSYITKVRATLMLITHWLT
jgi:hypothetical protein